MILPATGPPLFEPQSDLLLLSPNSTRPRAYLLRMLGLWSYNGEGRSTAGGGRFIIYSPPEPIRLFILPAHAAVRIRTERPPCRRSCRFDGDAASVFVFTHNTQRCRSPFLGLFSPTHHTLFFLSEQVYYTGFLLSLPWPTHPPSFAPCVHRLLTLLPLFVPPASMLPRGPCGRALVNGGESRIPVLEHCPGSGGRCPGAALALPWRCPELFDCWFYQNSTWIFRCSQKLCTETFYCAVQNDCEFD